MALTLSTASKEVPSGAVAADTTSWRSLERELSLSWAFLPLKCAFTLLDALVTVEVVAMRSVVVTSAALE